MFKLFSIGIALITISGSVGAQNLITNGGFETDFSSWQNLTGGGGTANFSIETTEVYAGANAMKAEIVSPGNNAWDVQSIHAGWNSVQDEEYQLTFWAKGSGNGEALRIVLQNTSYTQFEFSLTNQWKEYSQTFTAKEAGLQMKLHHHVAGVYFLDEFSIEATSTIPVEPLVFNLDPSVHYQEMIGFGGALTWFCDRVTSSPYQNELTQLLFDDLGLDILRLKNWYYPLDYPSYKGTDDFHTGWFKPHFQASQELYSSLKSSNPNAKVLLSSWGPPVSLKSNNDLSGGTLKQENGEFVYGQFADYWDDVLDNVGFSPDWISIQNEPGYQNTWTTSQWRPSETATFPSYTTAFDSVYAHLKQRSNAPLMLGGESENIGTTSWDNALNTFREFSAPLKGKEGVYAYAYHLYNYYNSSKIEGDKGLLNIIRDEFDDKPNIMTEFSNESLTWSEMASVIQNTLIEANASGYVYWNMIWDENSDNAMITIDANGDYVVSAYYYLIKHFAKHVSEGDYRVELTGSDVNVKGTAFLRPETDSLTLVFTNQQSEDATIELDHLKGDLSLGEAFQSTEASYYQSADLPNWESIVLPANSVTTITAKWNNTITNYPSEKDDKQSAALVYPNPTSGMVYLSDVVNYSVSSLIGAEVLVGTSNAIDMTSLANGTYLIQVGNEVVRVGKK